tara:strand:+ start:2037 stop:2894 length:858 start_codon:yes stop_codon:yes gene_type:complete
MTEDIPQIQHTEKVYALYACYKGVSDDIEMSISKGKSTRDPRKVDVSSSDLVSGLDRFLINADAYLSFAKGLAYLGHELRAFREGADERIKYVLGHTQGKFTGKFGSEISGRGTVFGIVPYGVSGQARGEVKGDIDLTSYGLELMLNVTPSSHQWLKDFLGQGVLEINGALESVEESETNSRLNVEMGRANNAIRDCYSDDSGAVNLRFASQNLSEGLGRVRNTVFPNTSCFFEHNGYYEACRRFVGKVEERIGHLREIKEKTDEFDEVRLFGPMLDPRKYETCK